MATMVLNGICESVFVNFLCCCQWDHVAAGSVVSVEALARYISGRDGQAETIRFFEERLALVFVH